MQQTAAMYAKRNNKTVIFKICAPYTNFISEYLHKIFTRCSHSERCWNIVTITRKHQKTFANIVKICQKRCQEKNHPEIKTRKGLWLGLALD